MLKKVPINQLIPIIELSNLIAITKNNTINWRIEFSEGEVSNTFSYKLVKNKDVVFDITHIKESNKDKFSLTYVRITSDDKLDSIYVDIL